MTDVDVVRGRGWRRGSVGGAGRCARGGCRVAVLEAAARIGGRAYTTRPAALDGAAFDHGASWLHAAERNPLVPLALAAGETLINSDAIRTHRTFVGNRLATAAELAAYDAADTRFHKEMSARARAALPDVSLLEAAAPLLDDPWTATVLTWESAVIAAAEAVDLSLHDWHANLLHGTNLALAGGIGDFVQRVLGPAAGPVRLETPVRRIRWRRPGRGGNVGGQHSRGGRDRHRLDRCAGLRCHRVRPAAADGNAGGDRRPADGVADQAGIPRRRG